MPQQTVKRKLILASSSPYRKLLLERLGIGFEVTSPLVDETRVGEERAERLVARLATEKAQAAGAAYPSALIIGSDQVAVCEERIVGKPGDAPGAIAQLREFSGKTVHFLTAVTVLCRETAFCYERTVETRVRFRELSIGEIKRYVDADNPVDCAGSFKSEAGGISLLQSLVSDDPTAIIGLPLIAVSEALRRAGFQAP